MFLAAYSKGYRFALVAALVFGALGSSHAQLTVNRLFPLNTNVPDFESFTNTQTWTNMGITNISANGVTVTLSLSTFGFVGETDAFVTYNPGQSNQVLNATIYNTNASQSTSLLTNVVLTNTFSSPGVNNTWRLLFNNDNINDAVTLDYWRVAVTGGAVTNGTIEVGPGGIISGTDGYTVNAVVSAGSGTGSNAVTASVTNNYSLNFHGGISGSGELAKTGAGTLSLAGNSSGFSGTFALNAGTAHLTTTTALGTGVLVQSNGSSTAIFSAGGTYANNMSLYNVSFTNGGNTLSGTITNNNTVYNVGSSTLNTLSGTLVGSGGMTKAGSGTLVLSGNNSFGGVLTVAEGKLNIGTINNASANGVLGNSTNAVVLGTNGQTGFLHYTGGTASSDKRFTAASGGTAGIEVSNASTTLTLSGVIDGSGNVQKGGAGILHLSGNNTFGGTLSIHDGTLQIGAINNTSTAGVLGNSANAVELGKSGTTNIATLRYTGGTASSTKAFSLVSSNNVAAVIDITNSAADLSLSGIISGTSGLTKTGAGTLTLSGNNTFGGTLTVAEGKLTVGSVNSNNVAGVLGQSTNAVVLGSSGQTGFLHYVGTANTSSDKAFTAASDGTAGIEVSNATTTLTLSGAIGGSGNVQKGGAGILHLTGNNTFTGTLRIHDGTLQIGTINDANTAGVLGNSANAVEIGKTNTSNTSTLLYTGGTASSTKTFTLMSETNAAGVINVSNAATALTLSGAIGGVGRLEKSGAGTLVLSASNNYAGGTTLSAGTLRVGQTHALGNGHLSQTGTNSLLQIGTTGTIANSMTLYNVQVSANATLTGAKTLANATYTVDSGITSTEQGVLSGSGGLTKEGGGDLLLHGSANNTYTGATVVNAGRLILSNSAGNAINSSSGITLNTGGTLVLGASNQIGDGIGLVLNGGTFLVGASTITEQLGTLTLSANSVLDLGAYGNTGSRTLTFASSAGVTWATNATLTITNWQGVANTASDFTDIFFGVGGLSTTQRGQIFFANQNITGGNLLGSGELVPVPEPRVYAAAIALLAAVGWRERRRIASLLGALRAPSRDPNA